ncbi:MAG: hypothetical protein E7616_02585 [Ruminococcaceae bacterium]|nr:hypothetical protein [Oscillospiraceae bacterium]
MRKQSLFVRLIVFIFSLVFCGIAFTAILSGMLFSSAGKLISAKYLAEAIGDEIHIGTVLNTVSGNDKYEDDASMSQITLEKLDPATIEKYNLTEENLDQLYETEGFKKFISEKMGNAMESAVDGETFEMTGDEIIAVIRESEQEFTEITGVTMNEENYAELEKAVADAGFAKYEYNFAEKGTIGDISFIKTFLSSRLDLVLFGVGIAAFLFIFLFNLRKKRRLFFYAGVVISLCGALFIHIKTVITYAFDLLGIKALDSLKPILDIVGNITTNDGMFALRIGIGLLVVYVVLSVVTFARRIKNK